MISWLDVTVDVDSRDCDLVVDIGFTSVSHYTGCEPTRLSKIFGGSKSSGSERVRHMRFS